MISWLNDWLTQVILIILLAAFVDLLLPSQAMQRYVRTVLSLFLLLALLSPLFQLLQRDWDADELIAAAQQSQEQAAYEVSGSGIGRQTQSLEAVLADSEKLRDKNIQEAKQITEQQLAEEMKSGLERAIGTEVIQLEAQISIDETGEPVISSVKVVLLHRSDTTSELTDEAYREAYVNMAVKEVKVEPVQVSISSERLAEAEVEESQAQHENEQRSLIIEFLQNEWLVPRNRITIEFGA